MAPTPRVRARTTPVAALALQRQIGNHATARLLGPGEPGTGAPNPWSEESPLAAVLESFDALAQAEADLRRREAELETGSVAMSAATAADASEQSRALAEAEAERLRLEATSQLLSSIVGAAGEGMTLGGARASWDPGGEMRANAPDGPFGLMGNTVAGSTGEFINSLSEVERGEQAALAQVLEGSLQALQRFEENAAAGSSEEILAQALELIQRIGDSSAQFPRGV